MAKNNDNTIYRRQLIPLIFFSILTYKIVMLPKYLSMGAPRDYVVGMAIATALEMALFSMVFYVISNRQLSYMYANIWVKRVILLMIIISSAIKFLVLSIETLDYVSSLLFQEGRWLFIILTLMPALGYMAYKGARVIARVSEILVWAVLITLIFTMIFMRADINAGNLSPLFDNGVGGVTDTFLSHSLWFGDYTPFLVLCLERPQTRLDKKAIPIGMVVTYVVTIGFFVLFQSIYADVAPYIRYAFSNIAIYNSLSYLLGGVDFPIVCVWMLMSIVKLSFLLYSIRYSIEGIIFKDTSKGKRAGVIIIITVIYMLVLSFAVSSYAEIYLFAIGEIRYLVLAIDVALPIVLLVPTMILKRANRGNRRAYRYVLSEEGDSNV